MKNENKTGPSRDDRRFLRVPLETPVAYRTSADDEGRATASDVSRSGLRLNLGRYLRPGTRVMVDVHRDGQSAQPVELKTKIVWCRPTATGRTFEAGLRVYHTDHDVITGMSDLVHDGLSGIHLSNDPEGRPRVHRWTVLPDPVMEPSLNLCACGCR